jgi:hypothetical protein
MSRIINILRLPISFGHLTKGVAVEFALSADGPMTPGEA